MLKLDPKQTTASKFDNPSASGHSKSNIRLEKLEWKGELRISLVDSENYRPLHASNSNSQKKLAFHPKKTRRYVISTFPVPVVVRFPTNS